MLATNFHEVADHFEVSREEVSKWRQLGAPELRGRPYDCEKLKLWLIEKGLREKPEPESKSAAQPAQAAKPAAKSPMWIAIIGGVLTLLTGVVGNTVQGVVNLMNQRQAHEATAKLEKQKEQSALILKAIDTKGDNKKAAENLKFMLDAGLIEENEKLRTLVKKGSVVSISIGEVPRISAPEGFDNQAVAEAVKELAKLYKSEKYDPKVLQFDFKAYYENPLRVGPRVTTIAATNRKVLFCAKLASAMLEVASQDEGVLHVADWTAKEKRLLEDAQRPDDYEDSLLTELEAEVWRRFLDDWRAKATSLGDNVKFRKALNSAAHLIAREFCRDEIEQYLSRQESMLVNHVRYFIEALPEKMDKARAREHFKIGWEVWARELKLTAVEVLSESEANVIIKSAPFGQELPDELTVLTDIGPPTASTTLRFLFDETEPWDSWEDDELRSIVAHEIGHLLGIRHADVPPSRSLMSPILSQIFEPQPGDIAAALSKGWQLRDRSVPRRGDSSSTGIGQELLKPLAERLLRPDETTEAWPLSEAYFREQFQVKRVVKGTKVIGPATIPFEGRLALADTERRFIVTLQVAITMHRLALEYGDQSDLLIQQWDAAAKRVLDDLVTQNTDGISLLSEIELLAWQSFLVEWKADAIEAFPDDFKGALLQSARELAKLGLNNRVQEPLVREAE